MFHISFIKSNAQNTPFSGLKAVHNRRLELTLQSNSGRGERRCGALYPYRGPQGYIVAPLRVLTEHNGPSLTPSLDGNNMSCEDAGSSSRDTFQSESGNKGSLFGAIALITGSTVGAGMLALPAVTAPAGFVPTAAALTGTWALLTCQALLMAEVNLTLMEENKNNNSNGDAIVTLRQMAEQTLGKSGKVITVVYLLLSYCLLVAYLAKGAEIIDFFAGHAIPPAAGATAFVAATAALFLTGGRSAADKLNQAATSALLVLFALILGAGFNEVDVPHAISHGATRWDALTPAVPIMFLSLVYHDLVPLICSYLKGDRRAIRAALVLGSLVPLGMFMSWEAVALALVPQNLAADPHNNVVFHEVASQILPTQNHVLGVNLGGGGAAGVGAPGINSMDPVHQISLATVVPASTDVMAAPPIAVDPLQIFVRRSGPFIASTVQGFSFLAVFTSFLGTVMGLSETLRSEAPCAVRSLGRWLGLGFLASFCGDDDGNNNNNNFLAVSSRDARMSAPADNVSTSTRTGDAASKTGTTAAVWGTDPSQVLALVLTLGPPLAFTTENPDAFLAVLSIAGGYGMTAMYGILPPLMANKLRRQKRNAHVSSESVAGEGEAMHRNMLPGGVPALAGLLVVSVGIGLSRLAADAGGAFSVTAVSSPTPTGTENVIEIAMNHMLHGMTAMFL